MEKLIEAVALLAARIEDLPEGVSERELEVAKRVAELIREERKGLVYCGICTKGSFTKRGFYLHLMRVHKEDIKILLEKELGKLKEVV